MLINTNVLITNKHCFQWIRPDWTRINFAFHLQIHVALVIQNFLENELFVSSYDLCLVLFVINDCKHKMHQNLKETVLDFFLAEMRKKQ